MSLCQLGILAIGGEKQILTAILEARMPGRSEIAGRRFLHDKVPGAAVGHARNMDAASGF